MSNAEVSLANRVMPGTTEGQWAAQADADKAERDAATNLPTTPVDFSDLFGTTPVAVEIDDFATRKIDKAIKAYEKGQIKAYIRHLCDAINWVADKHDVHGWANVNDDPIAGC